MDTFKSSLEVKCSVDHNGVGAVWQVDDASPCGHGHVTGNSQAELGALIHWFSDQGDAQAWHQQWEAVPCSQSVKSRGRKKEGAALNRMRCSISEQSAVRAGARKQCKN